MKRKHPGGMLATQRPDPGASLGERVARYEERMKEMKADPKELRERMRDAIGHMRDDAKGLRKERLRLRRKSARARTPGRDRLISFYGLKPSSGKASRTRAKAR